jgi:hypothetical protein
MKEINQKILRVYLKQIIKKIFGRRFILSRTNVRMLRIQILNQVDYLIILPNCLIQIMKI